MDLQSSSYKSLVIEISKVLNIVQNTLESLEIEIDLFEEPLKDKKAKPLLPELFRSIPYNLKVLSLTSSYINLSA